MTELLHPVMLCGATEDIYVSSPQGGVMLYSKALEPLVIVGYCESQWLLVSNSAGLLAWFRLSPDDVARTTANDVLTLRRQSFTVVDISSDGRYFNLQYLHHMYSSDQMRRILTTISDSLRAALDGDCYFPEPDCSSCSPQCSGLPKDEFKFYADIAGQWINENLTKLSSFIAGQHDIHCLPAMNSSPVPRSERSESINFLCKCLADTVRATTGLRYSDAVNAVRTTLVALTKPTTSGGIVSEAHAEAFSSILYDAENEARENLQSAFSKSPDKETLESLLIRLMEWIEDAQRSATWRSSSDDSELLNILRKLKQLLEDADPMLCVDLLQKASPQALEAVIALYQLESAQDVRSSSRDFVLGWIQLIFNYRLQDPTNTMMLRMFASESGGGVLLAELLREFISNELLGESTCKSIMSLCDSLMENRTEFVANAELPCDMPAFFDAILRVAITYSSLLPLCLEMVERAVKCSISHDLVDGAKQYGKLMASSLLTCQNADAVELVIDGIIQRYLSLTIDKYLSNKRFLSSERNLDQLIVMLIFWVYAIVDPRLLEHGLVHTTDLKVLIDFCVRRIETFEIDSSCPKSLQDAYSMAHNMFITATSMEFF